MGDQVVLLWVHCSLWLLMDRIIVFQLESDALCFMSTKNDANWFGDPLKCGSNGLVILVCSLMPIDDE
jgi:hypothetical protein